MDMLKIGRVVSVEILQNGQVVIEKPKKGTSENFEIRTI